MGRRKKNSKRKRSKKNYISNKYKNVNEKRNQRDTVFRMLFKAKKELLPLRNLLYITKQLEKLIVKKDLYGRKLITLPNPRFIVFYKSEVISMSIFEYDEELHKKTLLSEGYEDGYADGHKEGFEDGVASKESEIHRLKEEIEKLKIQFSQK